MLTYINDNFLHAPSTDLSRDVIKLLVGVILAQATEVFFEKCTDEKKGSALVSKIASQAAFMYTGLSEEVKEFMGKGILDRNWVTVIQVCTRLYCMQNPVYPSWAYHHTNGRCMHSTCRICCRDIYPILLDGYRIPGIVSAVSPK